jgi:hypothetical protein
MTSKPPSEKSLPNSSPDVIPDSYDCPLCETELQFEYDTVSEQPYLYCPECMNGFNLSHKTPGELVTTVPGTCVTYEEC